MAQSTKEQIDKMFAGPTKRNHAGNQQPYVPAGNGDESGEYRDNVYGGRSVENKPTPQPKEAPKPKEIPLEEGVIVEETPKEEKKLSKKERIVKENQDNFKKSFPNTLVNFNGFDEEAQKNLIESAELVKKDFPTLERFLIEYGNPNAMTKEDKERIINEQLAKIDDEAINNYLNNFRKWNPHISQERFDTYYTKEWAREQLIRNAKNPYVPKRIGIGSHCAITVHKSWGEDSNKSKIYFRNKYIGKDCGDLTENYYNLNWWSTDKPNAIAVHELGHALDNYLFSSNWTRSLRQEINDIYYQEQDLIQQKKKEAGFGGRGIEDFSREEYQKRTGKKLYSVSEYAMTNTAEFVAECVAAHYGNMNNPTAEKVFDILQRAENMISQLGEMKG